MPVSFVSGFACPVVKSSVSVHFILREVALVVGAIRIGQFSVAFLHSLDNRAFINPPVFVDLLHHFNLGIRAGLSLVVRQVVSCERTACGWVGF